MPDFLIETSFKQMVYVDLACSSGISLRNPDSGANSLFLSGNQTDNPDGMLHFSLEYTGTATGIFYFSTSLTSYSLGQFLPVRYILPVSEL